MRRLNAEMLKGTVDLLILSVIRERDNYGYEISKAIKERTGGGLELQEATLYLSLKRLEKQGAIASYWGDQTHGGRRKYYAITAEGRELFDRYVRDWLQTRDIVDRFI
ncbi:PadR family transcriptional regulator [Cohnella zeiphila]|uniref:PadR family transcriptional regulator n=1 Tax=Cohnella zeiphila TaxID=2761120 RepID=UPI003080B468